MTTAYVRIADPVTMQQLAGQAASGEHYQALRRLAVLFGVLRGEGGACEPS